MADPGNGFWKFRCIYWLSHECPRLVAQNGDACGYCLSQGRPAGRQAIARPEFFTDLGLPDTTISGSAPGGYHMFSCTYRYERPCEYFVRQNGDACGRCLSEGRQSRRETDQGVESTPRDGILALTITRGPIKSRQAHLGDSAFGLFSGSGI